MAAVPQPIAPVKLPSRPSSLSPEQLYWRSFKSPVKHVSPTKHGITHITQPQTQSSALSTTTATITTSDHFVVSTGARVQLYSTRTGKLVKTLTRFPDTAYSGVLRPDGRVLAAGDETGQIQVFDVSSRAILRTWKESKTGVRCVRWHPSEATGLMSAGDDGVVRVWDLVGEKSVWQGNGGGAGDYVRAGDWLNEGSGGGRNVVVSGGYDGLVRLWDTRVDAGGNAVGGKGAVMTFQHTGAVESVLSMPGGATLLASAENAVAVLDIMAAKPRHLIKNHQKTVTDMCLASRGGRLVTGGLDGHVKVFETTGWNVVAGMKYASPILSLQVLRGSDGEDKHVAVGMSDGTLSVKTRLSGEAKVRERERQREMEALLAGTIEEHDRKMARIAKKKGKGWEKRFRGRDNTGEGADIVIDGNIRNDQDRKMKKWDRAMHATRFGEALDTALESGRQENVLAVLTELKYRSAVRAALEGRNEETLRPILAWVARNMSTTQYTDICVYVTMVIMDLYGKHVSESQIIGKVFEKMRQRILDEEVRSKQAIQTKGMLELLVPGVAG